MKEDIEYYERSSVHDETKFLTCAAYHAGHITVSHINNPWEVKINNGICEIDLGVEEANNLIEILQGAVKFMNRKPKLEE